MTYDISLEISLWALLFIMYIGVVWITILNKLQRIERLLKGLSTAKHKGDSPSNDRKDLYPRDMDV